MNLVEVDTVNTGFYLAEAAKGGPSTSLHQLRKPAAASMASMDDHLR